MRARTWLAAAAAALGVACGGGGGGGDATAPTVLSTAPSTGATGVSAEGAVTITFSEALDPASVTASCVSLSGGASGTVSGSGDTITWTPSATLASSTTYTVTVAATVADAAGNALAAPYAFTFTTEDYLPPVMVSTAPAAGSTGVPLGTAVSITFSEPVAAATLTPASFTLSGGVAGSVAVSGATATFTPSAPLASGTTYTATVGTAATDLAGNALAEPVSWSFTTVDLTPPLVIARAPAAGEAGVPTDAVVSVTFSEEIDPATVTAASFSLDGGVLAIPAADGVTATLTPIAPLEPDTLHTVTLTTAVKDLAGNALAAPVTWSFRTVDTVAPAIAARSPAPGATGVGLGAAVAVTFTEEVDPSTLTAASFSIEGVPGTIAVDGATATLTPSSPLSSNTSYTVTLGTAVTDLAGNALAAPAIWSFRTVDNVAPTVVSVFPAAGASGVQTNATLVANFSEDVDPASVTAATFTVSGGVAGTLTVAGSQVTFDPSSSLSPSASYTATLTTGVKDLAGNPLAAPYAWTFSTVANQAPTARAGADRNASFGEAVALDGSGSSDPEGGALTYVWSQTAGSGVGTLSGATPGFTAPADVVTLTFSLVVRDPLGATSTPDQVTVRVWVDRSRVILVSTAGNDASSGTFGAPVRNVTTGVTKAAALGAGGAVYVAAGSYTHTGSLALPSGMRVYGGFDGTTWDRDVAANVTTLNGGATAISIQGVSNVKLNGLVVNASAGATPGQSSIGVFVRSSTTVEITRCTLRSASGYAGAIGNAGAVGGTGASGAQGASGACNNDTSYGVGGSGGSYAWAGGNGGRGGYQSSSWRSGAAGSAGSGPYGGAGGSGGSSSGDYGSGGGVGGIGSTGGAGAGGASFGAFSSTAGYTPAPGTSGTSGTSGSGGGGGGGSYGQTGITVTDGAGNGGSGGGGGGYGGGGGGYGGGGAGSFGVIVMSSTGVSVQSSTVVTGNGGAAGRGGYGGAGGAGGPLTGRQCYCSNEIGCGGTGGRGGYGGSGGQGGGGGGGPSIGILEDVSSTTAISGVSYTLGNGGAGGTGTSPGAAGVRASWSKR